MAVKKKKSTSYLKKKNDYKIWNGLASVCDTDFPQSSANVYSLHVGGAKSL